MTATGWPQVEVGYRRNGTWRSPGYRSSRLRSRVLTVGLGLTIATDALLAFMAVQGFGIVDKAAAGMLGSAEAEAYDALVAGWSQASSVLFLVTGVALFAWLSRAVENVPPLTGLTPVRSPREAIGFWFAPFLNLVLPVQIVRDTIGRLRTSAEPGAERLVIPWWLLYIGANAIAMLEIGASQAQTIDGVRTLFAIRLVNEVATVLAGILLVMIVREIERRSSYRAGLLGLGRSGGATWPAMAGAEGVAADQADDRAITSLVASPDGPFAPPPPPPSALPPT